MASNSQSMAFGDIFEYKGEQFIYLIETEDITFAARILDGELSKWAIQGRASAERRNTYTINNLTYSFVVLKTPQVEGRVALLLGSDTNVPWGAQYTPLNMTLVKEDLKRIKEEIMEEKCVSERLKKELARIEV